MIISQIFSYLIFFLNHRYIRAIQSGCKKTSFNEAFKKNVQIDWYKKDYFYYVKKGARKDVDEANFLRLFECFMESGPQLLLQLYILLTNARQDNFHCSKIKIKIILKIIGNILKLRS